MLNETEVRRTLEIFKPNNELVEIRIIGKKKGEIYSGYYTNHEDVIRDIRQHTDKNIYFIFNNIKDVCYSKEQRDKLVYGADSTKDSDIAFREWILIDVDTNRGGNKVSSTDVELELARKKANKVRDFLRDMGFTYPVICLSGSGFHLMYKCKIACTDENTLLIKNFLEYLSLIFSDDEVGIDTVVHNNGRITRLYGTVNQKGANTIERPHRESKMLRVPTDIKAVDKSLIQKIADMIPKPEKATYHNNYGRDKFDIDNFISKHNINVAKDVRMADGTRKILLTNCPFNSAHTSPDSAIFITSDGRIGFKCMHASCSSYHWREFRSKFDPNAYDKQYNSPNRQTTPVKKEIVPQLENDNKGKVWEDFGDFDIDERDKIISIPSGLIKMDKITYGFDKPSISIWSGDNGSAKSTLLNQVALNAVNKGFKGGIWSGELKKGKLKRWIYQQAAGRQYTKKSTFNEYDYFVPQHISKKIDEWLKGKLRNYNRQYSNNIEVLIAEIRKEHAINPFDFIVLDNLAALDILTLEGDNNGKQKHLMLLLMKLVEDLDLACHIVMHPRKSNSFIRKDDISGNKNLSDLADNIFIIHRVNRIFEKFAPEYLRKEELDDILFNGYTNVVECLKHREFGIFEGQIVGLFYEIESKRLLNEKYENPIFGWQEVSSEQNLEFTENVSTFVEPNYDFESMLDDICPF